MVEQQAIHWLGMTPGAWFTIAAIVVGPFFALFTQRKLDNARAARERKLMVFKTLMTTRASFLAPQHVEALNIIDVEFYPAKGKNQRVVESWRLYLDHLNAEQREGWNDKRIDLLTDLIYDMARCLGYDFDKVMLKRVGYYPSGYFEMESEQHFLRKATLEVFLGTRPMTMTIVGPVMTMDSNTPPPPKHGGLADLKKP